MYIHDKRLRNPLERNNGGISYLDLQRFAMKQSKFVGKRQLSSDEIAMPGIYHFMKLFVPPKKLLNPTNFDYHTGTTSAKKPVYHEMSGYRRVLNTRNPFSRILAAYTDKFKLHPNRKQQFGDYWKISQKAEKNNFVKVKGYAASFHAFLRYVTQEEGEKHLQGHWQSIAYRCQPCRISYEYIMDIETGKVRDKVIRQGEMASKPLRKSLKQCLSPSKLVKIQHMFLKNFVSIHPCHHFIHLQQIKDLRKGQWKITMPKYPKLLSRKFMLNIIWILFYSDFLPKWFQIFIIWALMNLQIIKIRWFTKTNPTKIKAYIGNIITIS